MHTAKRDTEKDGLEVAEDIPLADDDTEVIGTSADRRDMFRMNKVQEMRRNFKAYSIFGFSMILTATWETVLDVASIGLSNGGTAGLIYMYIVVWIGFLCIYTSMAEQGSMAPTAGGQYHWVSEFAPRKYQKQLSYVVGWLCVIGWQVSVASVGFLAGTQIQGLLVLNYPWYVFERWHGTLLVIAIVVFAGFFNTLLARHLPIIEALIMIIHIGGFFGILIPLWVLSPQSDAHTVFTQFNNPGWSSTGTSCMVGILAAIAPMLGSDSVAHMSEEIQNASYILPRTMFWSTFFNGALGLIMVIGFCFCVGNVEEVVATPTGYAFIQVFYNSTGSLAATNAMTAIVMIMATFSCITIMASASRQLFSFARDQGSPFSAWLSQVPKGWDIPVNSIVVSILVTVLLSLINIGSSAAFNSIASLGGVALLSSYIISTSCLLWRKLANKPLLPSRFNLGTAGTIVNIAALCYLVVMFIFCFFPPVPLPYLTPVSMNWNALIFGVVCIWGVVYYLVWARKVYVGPVEYVRKLD